MPFDFASKDWPVLGLLLKPLLATFTTLLLGPVVRVWRMADVPLADAGLSRAVAL